MKKKLNLQNIFFLNTVFFIFFSALPGPVSSLAGLFLLLFLITYIFNGLRYKDWKLAKIGLERPLLLYVLALVISAVDAPILPWSLGKIISLLLAVFIVYSFSAAVKTKEEYQKFLKVIFWGGLILLLAGLYQFLYIVFGADFLNLTPFLKFIVIESRKLPRLSSLFLTKSGTNVYACYLALYSPLLAVLIWHKVKNNIYKYLALFLILINVVMTYSRALYLAFLVLLFIYGLINKYSKRLIISAIFIFILLALFVPPINRTVNSFFDRKDYSNIEHLQTFNSVIALIKEHPVNGWGADHVGRKIKKTPQGWVDGHGYKMSISAKEFTPTKFYEVREQAKKAGVISIDSPHNIYLWNFLELGIIGFLAFIYLMSAVLLKIISNAKKAKLNKALWQAMLWGYSAFLIYNLFQDSLTAPVMNAFFLIFIVLVAALEKFKAQKVI